MMPFEKFKNKPNTLKNQVLNAGKWASITQIVKGGFNLARILILARILSPTDFGLMGITLLALSVIERFSETGFGQKLIQLNKKENTEAYLDTVFWALAVRGICIAVIMILFASFIGNFFNSEQVIPLIKVIALSEIFKGFCSVGVFLLRKELEFKKLNFLQLSEILSDFIVTVVLAILYQSVWALVIGFVFGKFVLLVMSYIVYPYKPKFSFQWERLSTLWEFGKWILITAIIGFFVSNLEKIVIGKIIGVTALGFYQLAYRISIFPVKQISVIVAKIAFPTFSKLQDNVEKFKNAFIVNLQISSIFYLFLSGMIFLFADTFTRIFLGEKWIPIIPVLKVLAFIGVFKIFQVRPIAKAVSKPEIITKIQIIQLLVLIVTLYPLAVKFGVIGVAVSVILSLAVSQLFALLDIIKITRCSVNEVIKMISYPFVGIFIMTLFTLFLRGIALTQNGINGLITETIFCTLIFVFSVFILDKYFRYELIKNIRLYIL